MKTLGKQGNIDAPMRALLCAAGYCRLPHPRIAGASALLASFHFSPRLHNTFRHQHSHACFIDRRKKMQAEAANTRLDV
jgi:hypothetical protein